MLDTSALIGLHEGQPEVATYLAGVLDQHDDGSVPKTHEVVLGELWSGVLAVGDADDPDNPRRAVLDTAAVLDIETITDDDAFTYARITAATKRAMSNNDRWICAAAIRTRSTLITQDADMAGQLHRFFDSLELLEALRFNLRVVYVHRDPEQLARTRAESALDTIRVIDGIERLLAGLDPREAEVLKVRFGLDRGEPRTLEEVAEHFNLTAARIAQIEKRAIARLRS